MTKQDVDILVFAMRYALKRSTSAPSVVINAIQDAWPKLATYDKRQIQEEIKVSVQDVSMPEYIKLEWFKILELEFWGMSKPMGGKIASKS